MWIFVCFRVDDIEDNSCLRRGVPVAHSIYGVASTINAANYVFFLALEKVQQLGHSDVSAAWMVKSLIYHNADICIVANWPEILKLNPIFQQKNIYNFRFRQQKFIQSNCWNCTVVKEWKFTGVIISHVPLNRSTN